MEPVPGAAAPVDPIELFEGDQAGVTQGGDSAGRGVFGDTKLCGDAADTD
jgi:hypothetical protein